MTGADNPWPKLPIGAWVETMETLKLWTQIVGKLRLARTPWLNHAWHVTLYVTARGLTTGLVPHGHRGLELEFDFISQALIIRTTDGSVRQVELAPRSVSDFYDAVMSSLADVGMPISIHAAPNEVPSSVPFEADHANRIYDAGSAEAFWRALLQTDRVFKLFRTRFIGKCSPVHFFWGAADLAVTRFSGRPAPRHPGGIPHLPDAVTEEAYSHEVSSAGFWPGGGGDIDEPAFYSYAWPQPSGYSQASVRPADARYDTTLGEFVLPYPALRASARPDDALLDFLQSTYEAADDLAAWDRAALEAPTGEPGRARPLGGRPAK